MAHLKKKNSEVRDLKMFIGIYNQIEILQLDLQVNKSKKKKNLGI